MILTYLRLLCMTLFFCVDGSKSSWQEAEELVNEMFSNNIPRDEYTYCAAMNVSIFSFLAPSVLYICRIPPPPGTSLILLAVANPSPKWSATTHTPARIVRCLALYSTFSWRSSFCCCIPLCQTMLNVNSNIFN